MVLLLKDLAVSIWWNDEAKGFLIHFPLMGHQAVGEAIAVKCPNSY